jgi:hypothetical protein
MSISAPPGQPSITETLSTSFRDAASLAKKNLTPTVIAIALGTIAAYFGVTQSKASTASLSPAASVWFVLAYFALIVVSYYSNASAVRTLNADYRMTVGHFFAFIGYAIVVSLLTGIAGIFFLIPAYWVGIKLLLTPYTYIVTNGAPGSIKTTWNMTTGYYWQTFGMLLLAGICVGVLAYAAFFICGFIALAAPISVIVVGPLALAVLIWLIHVTALIHVRWVWELLPRSNMPHAVPVPA